MKPFELRLAQEHLKSSRHLKNLSNFTSDPSRFNLLPIEQRSLMLEQEATLSRYVNILEKRLQNLGIPI